jgi:hypothetical protein
MYVNIKLRRNEGVIMIKVLSLKNLNTISAKDTLVTKAENKNLKVKNGEFNEAISEAAKEFFTKLLKEDPAINGETYRSYLNIGSIDLFVANGLCWIAVRDSEKLKFMTCYPIEELKKD